MSSLANSNQNTDRFIVLTGGPGSGKTSLIAALRRLGYAHTQESGRAIIQDQLAIGGHALPWDNRLLFAELMLSWDIRSYRIAQQCSAPVFFDRSVVDVLGYLRLIGASVPPHVQNAAEIFRHNSAVFIAPPWEEIFAQDQERKQDFAEAVRTYEVLSATYRGCGYNLIELPRASVEQRVQFIFHNLPLLNSFPRPK